MGVPLDATITEVVAELATLDGEPVAVTSDAIAELDRRWKKIEPPAHGSTRARRSVAAHVGYTAIPPVTGSIELDWSDDALADLDRFAAFLEEQSPELAAIVAEEIIARAQLLRHSKLGRPTTLSSKRRLAILYSRF